MRTIKAMLLLAALALTGLASAALEPQVNVLEFGYDVVGVPAHEADRLTVKPCSSCEPATLSYTSGTVYRLNGADSQPVTLQQFRTAVRQTRDKDAMLFYVSYAVDSLRITELVLSGVSLDSVE